MRVEYRAGRTGQPGVPTAKVFVLMDSQRLALHEASADAVGAFARLAPVSAQPQPRTFENAPFAGCGDTVEDDTARIGQQYRMPGT
ncbi:hypothetical protein D3C81_1305680 [compost metagenome]